MSFHFVRMTPEGKLSTPVCGPYATREEAKTKGEPTLKGLRKTNRVVLVEVVEEVDIKVSVNYTKYKEAMQKAGRRV